MRYDHFPKKQGLYDPRFEHDSCGVGFVCDIKGRKSHDIIKKGIKVLNRLSHRGAVGADPDTGDGAGILIQIPHKFFMKECSKLNIPLPEKGEYGTGFVFLPRDKKERTSCIEIIENTVKKEKKVLLGWREVPLNSSIIGKTAKQTEPVILQVFLGEENGVKDQDDFERYLYIIRREIENSIRRSDIAGKAFFYITNLSSRTISYKGLLMPHQLDKYFLDLNDADLESAVCLVHSRYSTNTFPTWDLAQPFRFLAHNGEINTLRGNINWMKARERLLASTFFGPDIEKIKPVIIEGGSDSASIDNIFELLVLSGRSLQHAMMMLIPAAWEHDRFITKELKEFYRYHACFMEPWDGPASIAFTDGEKIGAILDRNGLRPSRYLVTKNDLVVMASEVGVLDIDPAEIKFSGRLEPGKIFFIDTSRGVIVEDSEIKKEMAKKKPYGKWNKESLLDLDSITGTSQASSAAEGVASRLKAFGYTREDMKTIIKPMAEEAKEPIGSMGNDTPHAFLSKRPVMLYDYFKQLFAQVTNPPIDHIREKVVMGIESYVGSEKNILDETPGHSHKLIIKSPILTNSEMEKIRSIGINSFRTKTIYTFFNIADENGFERALERICFETEYAIEKGYSFIILSDRGSDKEHIALPALLAVAAVHHHLVRKSIRSQAGLFVESAEPREVHHFALLIGYGADCINPYLAYEAVKYLISENEINLNIEKALQNYRESINEGIMKILSKMGISTLRSYRGAQMFEALGIGQNVIDKYFTGTVSRIGGVNLSGIAEETYKRHKEAYPASAPANYLPTGGIYQWKRDGEHHLWNPATIAALQDASRQNDYEKYKYFAALINDQSQNPTTLRGLLKFKIRNAVPLEEVEGAEEIVKRFVTGAMSFGSISRFAHETIALAMNKLGAKSNTGEGGEDPARFSPLKNGDSKRSAVKQVASGRFGVTANYLVNADEIQIKIAQGAKPGEGGQLPGHKVSEIIAKTRYTTAGVTLISPPPHHDIYSIEDLAELIFDLKSINPRARISVKLVSEIGVGTVAAGVAKGHADMILISGGDGGTGASPRSSIRHAGLPWELGLSETHQTLVLNNLRTRVRLQTDGQMRTGRDVAIAALLGAEEYGFCTAALIILGCVMLRHCHLNNCSVGIATQDELLQKRFRGKPEYLINYFRFVAEELRQIMAQLGFRRVDEMIGRTDALELNQDIIPPKAKGVDYSKILYRPESDAASYCTEKQTHNIYDIIDIKLIKLAKKALEAREPVKIELTIRNVDRATGAMLSGEVCKRYGENGLLEDTICCKFTGIAGQSFGAFLMNGVTLELEGLANDYVGKGISGGKIIIYPDRRADYEPDKNIIIGNTTFYGAIRGEAYISGVAGERFCIRNSGLYAVVEGVGDHGCEYMTGGRVVIIGKTGKNFAAGMSGGIAYVYDESNDFKNRCNTEMVLLEKTEDNDKETLERLLHNHHRYTKSRKAKIILDNINEEIKKFIKVMPIEYKQVIKGFKSGQAIGLTEVSDG
ncbi:MAG: glutamate synthase large subunit [Candidatus Omnitrophica bacterium]|nr:glutamate synthase large subunit [Candidatus Omnitrophota bacterium]